MEKKSNADEISLYTYPSWFYTKHNDGRIILETNLDYIENKLVIRCEFLFF